MTAQTITMSATGAVQTSPQTLRDNLVDYVAADVPDYTANFPASLIEDIVSTDVGAMVVCDSAMVDLINSVSPTNSNIFILNQQAAAAGIAPMGFPSRTSVYVVFTGLAGYVIPKGFVVSDSTYQYTTQANAVIETGGTSSPVYCVATVDGSLAVNVNTVTTIATSIPVSATLTVDNPAAGVAGEGTETTAEFRSRVLTSWTIGSQGMARYLKTQLTNVSGVQQRLVSVKQLSGQWEIICGGGDPYEVAGAIYNSVFDVSNLSGSVMAVTGISVAANAVVTTSMNHGLVTGQSGVLIDGVVGTMSATINGAALTIVVLSPTTFTCGKNTTGLAYTSGGVVTPNTRNISVDLYDYPDTYTIPFVNPPMQTVGIVITWNTSSSNVVSAAAVAALANPAVVDYINSIPVGQPINTLTLGEVFKESIAAILSPELIVRLLFAVTINSISASVVSGELIILSDPESYFYTQSSSISFVQG